MIRELVEYYFTPVSPEAKKSGYLYEALAFQARARRNSRHWQAHWDNCHQMVEQFAHENQNARNLLILGSGCLFEFPKNFLLEKFDQIYLVDQVFPLSVQRWTGLNKDQISLIEMDLTKKFPVDMNVDLVISANLLSQLSLPYENPEKRKVESKHIQNLQALGKPVLLWTDIEKSYLNTTSKEILEIEKTIQLKLKNVIKEWSWNLAPAPEISKKFDVSLKVQACRF